MGSIICLNTNTNAIQVRKFGWIRIQISFWVPLLSKSRYKYSDYSNNIEYNYKLFRMKIQIIPNMNTKLLKSNKYPNLEQCLWIQKRTWNVDLGWNLYYLVSKLKANTNTNSIWVWIQIRIHSVYKNHPNTNTNSIRLENICRIWISLFGLNYSNTEVI